jgi:hypothetical protein
VPELPNPRVQPFDAGCVRVGLLSGLEALATAVKMTLVLSADSTKAKRVSSFMMHCAIDDGRPSSGMSVKQKIGSTLVFSQCQQSPAPSCPHVAMCDP